MVCDKVATFTVPTPCTGIAISLKDRFTPSDTLFRFSDIVVYWIDTTPPTVMVFSSGIHPIGCLPNSGCVVAGSTTKTLFFRRFNLKEYLRALATSLFKIFDRFTFLTQGRLTDIFPPLLTEWRTFFTEPAFMAFSEPPLVSSLHMLRVLYTIVFLQLNVIFLGILPHKLRILFALCHHDVLIRIFSATS